MVIALALDGYWIERTLPWIVDQTINTCATPRDSLIEQL